MKGKKIMQKQKHSHSKLPFSIKDDGCDVWVATPAGNNVLDDYNGIEEMNANARFIVKACNNHYQLLEALKLAADFIPSSHRIMPLIEQTISKAESEG